MRPVPNVNANTRHQKSGTTKPARRSPGSRRSARTSWRAALHMSEKKPVVMRNLCSPAKRTG